MSCTDAQLRARRSSLPRTRRRTPTLSELLSKIALQGALAVLLFNLGHTCEGNCFVWGPKTALGSEIVEWEHSKHRSLQLDDRNPPFHAACCEQRQWGASLGGAQRVDENSTKITTSLSVCHCGLGSRNSQWLEGCNGATHSDTEAGRHGSDGTSDSDSECGIEYTAQACVQL